MSERRRGEKDEKNHDEKGGEGVEEKWRRDPFSAIFFGLVVVLLGVFLFLGLQGIIEWNKWWAYFLLGIGCIFILDVLIRYLLPVYRRPVFGRVLIGLILIAIGGSNIGGIQDWWPIIVIVVGLAVLIYGVLRARRPFG